MNERQVSVGHKHPHRDEWCYCNKPVPAPAVLMSGDGAHWSDSVIRSALSAEEQESMFYAIDVLEGKRFPRSPAGSRDAKVNRAHIAVLYRIAHGGIVEF